MTTLDAAAPPPGDDRAEMTTWPLTVPCPACPAEYGQPCRAQGGMPRFHPVRRELAALRPHPGRRGPQEAAGGRSRAVLDVLARTPAIAARDVPCPLCGASVDAPCRAASGTDRKGYYHAARLRKAADELVWAMTQGWRFRPRKYLAAASDARTVSIRDRSDG